MNYPEDVITSNKKGKPEIRTLIDKGTFIRYHYTDPKTGKILEKGKYSILLTTSEGKEEHLYFIPLPGKRFLAFPAKEEKTSRKIWDKKKKKAVTPKSIP